MDAAWFNAISDYLKASIGLPKRYDSRTVISESYEISILRNLKESEERPRAALSSQLI